MRLSQNTRHLAFTASCALFLSGCNFDSSNAEQGLPKVSKRFCASEDKSSTEFWACDANRKIEFSVFVEASDLSIKLRDGEFFLSRNLGHLDDPEFEDMLTVSDSLPFLVRIVCSDASDMKKIVFSGGGLNEGSSRLEVNLPARRSINEDPNVYEWRLMAKDVYRLLNRYCL